MNQKKKNILLGVLIVGVISMSVAFAALSTNLSINGSASIPTTSWNIHFANNHDSTQSPHQDGTVNRGTITGVQFAATSITGFTATLYQPNDEVVYEFDIVNEGTIDAQLDNFTKTLTCNTSNCSMITYTIDCEDASHNDANQSDYILAHGQSVSCVMKIKYNEQTNSGNGVYEQGAVNATASASWIYKQVEGNGGSGNNSGNENGGSGSGQSGEEQGQGGEENSSCLLTGQYGYDFVGGTSATNGGPCEWTNALSPDTKAYERYNTTTGNQDVCVVLSGGTVCVNLTSGLEKQSEFVSKGATCTIEHKDDYSTLFCREGSVACMVYSDLYGASCTEGYVTAEDDICSDSNGGCFNLYYDENNGCTSGHCDF